MVSHRDADKQASRWSDFLSSFVRGSKVFSQLKRPRISLCDKKIFIHSSRLSLLFCERLERLSLWQLNKKFRAKPVYPRLLAPSFRSVLLLIIIEKQFKVCLTTARRRRAEEKGILKGERIAKNSAGRSLFNHQPPRRVLKHLSPLSGVSLVRFLPTGARNEHPPRFFGSFLADRGKKWTSPAFLADGGKKWTSIALDRYIIFLGEGFEGVLTS